ncbi:MAG: phosphohydrolase [Mycobacteriaceae bacterium]|nr:phosphohydrolase [Mycobacteriaceae bacterium]
MSDTDPLDWAWATRTSGNLSARQRRHLIGAILRDVPGALAGQLRYRMGRRGDGKTDFAQPVPDSALARRVEDLVAEELSPHVRNHSYRCYYLGKALADQAGVAYDDELSYIAALLHDLNLEHRTPGRCFAVTGGERALKILTGWGVDPARAEAVAAAGHGHATPGADHNLGDPAGLVLAGSLADCLGRRLDQLDPQWLAQLQTRYPRHDFKRHLIPALRGESKAVPGGRIRVVNRWAAFPLLVRTAPYPE